jgi:hypothetical protein
VTDDAKNTPPPALAGRPDARVLSVEKLIAEVLSGRVRIPKFQRPLRWDAKDVLSLLDSIYRGYPVGTLLLWQRPAAEEHIVHATVTIEAPAFTDALWVVDGQQRIVSLTRALAGGGFPADDFAAFFDLQRRVFTRPSRREPAPPHYLPLTEVLDSRHLMHWLRKSQLDEELESVAFEVGKLREYQVPAYVVATEDERSVREIFRRANNTGKRMEDSDVFNALYSAGGSPASLPEVASMLAGVGFGTPDPPTLLRMLQAMRGTDLTKDRVPELKPEEARQAMHELLASARSTLQFLREDARIAHISLLPYQQPLLALARFFHRFPEPHPRSRELLARWVWRGAVMGVHDGSTVGARQMLAAIADAEHDAVQNLLRSLPMSREVLHLENYSFGHARCTIQLLALLELEPRDLRSGAPVFADMAPDSYKAMVRTICPDTTSAPDTLANRMFHTSIHSGLVRAIVACEDLDILASHSISADARRALKFDRPHEFLARRREELQLIVDDFAARRTEWEESDSPPIESLRVEAV